MSNVLDRSLAPGPGAATLVKVADPTTFTLDNGMPVILVPDHRLPLVTMQFRADVPPTAFGPLTGLSELFGELLLAGTTRHTKEWIDEAIDAMGAMVQAHADGVYATGLREHANDMMALLAELVSTPAFPDDEFQKARRRMLSAVAQRAQDPDGLGEVIGRQAVFGAEHPYGEVVTEATLGQVQPAHLHAWHAHAYHPQRAALVLVGDLSEADARTLAATHFGGWQGLPAPAGNWPAALPVLHQPVVAGEGVRIHGVHRPGAEQSVIRVGFPLDLPPGHEKALPARLMNTILGGGIFNARLMANLREDKGWTYGIYSALDVDRHNASLIVHVNVRTEVTAAAVHEIMAEMQRMRTAPVEPAELELARSHLAGSFGRSLEDPRTLAQFALNIRLFGLPPGHYRTYLTRLEKVSAQEVQQAATAFLHPDRAAVVVIGDREGIEKAAPEFAQGMVMLDADGHLL